MKTQEFIEEHVKKIEFLSTKGNIAYWNASISGKGKDFQKFERITKEIKQIYNKKEEFEKVGYLLKKEKNLSLKRQLKILYNEYLSAQGDLHLLNDIISKGIKIEQKFNNFRAEIESKKLTDNQIKEILIKETNSEKLQKVWEASKKQGELVEKDIIEVVKLRNKLAKNLGFDNFYSFSLETAEQNESVLTQIFDELEKKSSKAYNNIKSEIDNYLAKRYNISLAELKPWHYQDLFFQEAPKIHEINLDQIYEKTDILEIAKKFYDSIGLPVEDILERSSLYEQEGKSQHAYCLDIDRKGDVRILQNIKNNEKWFSTTLHELGHAVYQKFIDPSLPYLERDNAHTFTTEAIAMLFGRQSKNSFVIKNYTNTDISKSKSDIIHSLKLTQLVFLGWAQVMFRFEKELYKNPNQDLNKLWWSLVSKYQLINFSRDKPDWASKIHFVIAPVYYHNYVLGELLASQLHYTIAKKTIKQEEIINANYIGKKEIGEYFKKHVFSVGKKYSWNEMIERATGEKLTPKYYLNEFVE